MDASSEQMRQHHCVKVTFLILNLIALTLKRRRNDNFQLFDAHLNIKSKISSCYVLFQVTTVTTLFQACVAEMIMERTCNRSMHVRKYKRPYDDQLPYVSDLL